MGKKKEEKYRLTFKGLMHVVQGKTPEDMLTHIELYMMKIKCNAIVLDKGEFHFANGVL